MIGSEIQVGDLYDGGEVTGTVYSLIDYGTHRHVMIQDTNRVLFMLYVNNDREQGTRFTRPAPTTTLTDAEAFVQTKASHTKHYSRRMARLARTLATLEISDERVTAVINASVRLRNAWRAEHDR